MKSWEWAWRRGYSQYADITINYFIQALKSQYTEKEGYCIRKPKMFIFKDLEDGLEPYLLIKAEDEKCVMAADPKNKKVNDLFNLHIQFDFHCMLVQREN